jgi:hypothetical protein
MQDINMQKILGWLFGIEAFLTLPTYLWDCLHPISGPIGPLPLRNLLLAVYLLALIIIFAAACLTVLKRIPSARGWAIAASIAYFLTYLLQLASPKRFIWWHDLADLLLGVIGLIVFSHRPQPQSTSS